MVCAWNNNEMPTREVVNPAVMSFMILRFLFVKWESANINIRGKQNAYTCSEVFISTGDSQSGSHWSPELWALRTPKILSLRLQEHQCRLGRERWVHWCWEKLEVFICILINYGGSCLVTLFPSPFTPFCSFAFLWHSNFFLFLI